MKKLYFLFTIALAAGTVTAQKHASELGKKNKYAAFETVAKKTTNHQPKGVTIWSNDFSNSAEWTYDNTSAPFLDWVITTAADTIPVTALSPALFTTVNNGFAFINSDAQGQNGTQDANMTYTGMIDCSGYLNVSLVFENSYRTYLDTRIVRVSNNGGTTWTDFVVTDGTEPTAQNTANPEITSLNVSAVAGGNDSVMIQLNYQGNWGWYWAIDDIKLVETDQYDLKLQSIQWGTDGPFGARLAYYQVPNNQIAPINLGGIVQNIGVQNIGDALFTANINALYSGQSAPTAVASATQDTLWCTTTFTPAATNATHAVSFSVGSSQNELDLTNNAQPDINIEVNDYIYARDKDVIIGGIYNEGQGFEVGPVFDIFNTATLYGIDGIINTTAAEGAEIFAKLYYVNPTTGDFDFVDESLPYVITAADLGQKRTFALQTPQPLTAGESYLAMLGTYGDGGASNDLVVASAGGAPAQTVYYLDYTDQTWYYTTSQVMVRMNFDQAAGIQTSTEIGFSVQPNPANEVLNIILEEGAQGIVSLVSVTGSTVYTGTIHNGMLGIDTRALDSGIYFVSLNNGVARKVVIQH
ncbi:MAG: T9SS type A sorting domain-containing protein [Crocinitomicaceae bacterium]|nr:T9SS type A sorting domain-containing protein [Crocinitomicaceae bacterium]